ncbi:MULTISPECIES: hypothetical protein [unclassified Aeromonas]|uniref:hypothetical protein n=1 Tax=unclassified Aeromonas TaxID=257493 RepID=UPI003528DA00
MENIKGSIGYLGLTDWWLNELSHEDRGIILANYNPMGSSSELLTEGDISWTTEEPIPLLYGIASWLKDSEHLDLCMKLFAKAKSLITPGTSALDIHFLHDSEIRVYYKNRHLIGLEPTITACDLQIRVADMSAKKLLIEYGYPLPSHRGYQQLSIILSNLYQYQRAIDLCIQAQGLGWSGDWDKRIVRYTKKMRENR